MSRRERFRALIPFGPSHPVQENDKAIDGQSIALDTAKTICQLASNLGSGALNVPGLQAAGSIGVQIIDIVKVRFIFLSTHPPNTNNSLENESQ